MMKRRERQSDVTEEELLGALTRSAVAAPGTTWHINADALKDFAAGVLDDGPERERILFHLGNCEVCATSLMELRAGATVPAA